MFVSRGKQLVLERIMTVSQGASEEFTYPAFLVTSIVDLLSSSSKILQLRFGNVLYNAITYP